MWIIILIFCFSFNLYSSKILINFDTGLKNNFNGNCGTFDFKPDDPEAYCRIKLINDTDHHNKGYYLQIDYDVFSSQPAFNGVWFQLNRADLTPYNRIEMAIRGDPDKGFTDRFKIEFKSGNAKAYYILKGITEKWKKFSIPFLEFNRESGNFSWERVDEMVFVFEDWRIAVKEGRLYIDDIKFIATEKETKISPKENIKKKSQIKALIGFPTKIFKRINISLDDKKFLYQIAKDTWLYFANIIDKDTYLVLDNIKVAEKLKDIVIGDYTNITNIGLQILAILSAYDLGFISEKEAIKMLKKLLKTLIKLKRWNELFYNYYKTRTAEIANKYISSIDNGWLASGLICLRNSFNGKFKSEVDKILNQMDFSKLYDKKIGQLYLGYDTEKGEYSPYHYGLIASESRIASIIAIGKGDIPEQHWFKIYRTLPPEWDWQKQIPKGKWNEYFGVKVYQGYYIYEDKKFVPSWGGSMFEFFMPNIVIDEQKWAKRSFGINNKNVLEVHILYSKKKGYKFWGFSPCSTPDDSFGGYHEFGVPELGTKGYEDGRVVTPHAIILPIQYKPEECIKTIKKLIKTYPEIYGEYGLYDSVNIQKNIVGKKYLALDQGMILITLNNYLNNRAIQKRFEKDKIFQNVKELLSIERFF